MRIDVHSYTCNFNNATCTWILTTLYYIIMLVIPRTKSPWLYICILSCFLLASLFYCSSLDNYTAELYCTFLFTAKTLFAILSTILCCALRLWSKIKKKSCLLGYAPSHNRCCRYSSKKYTHQYSLNKEKMIFSF
jgi:hypothetical protein